MDQYFIPSAPGSFGGVKSLAKYSNKTVKEARDWLSGQDAYTLHKQSKIHFKRRKTISLGVDHIWQADLADLSSLANYNDRYRYILTVIDIFSRKARALPLKKKTGASITEAFAKMIIHTKPTMLQTDRGTEFKNATFQKLLQDNDITFYTSENDDIKAALIERFNRTLKSKMYKYFTHKSTLRYVDILQDLVDSYNNTVHSVIRMTPNSVKTNHERKFHALLQSRQSRQGGAAAKGVPSAAAPSRSYKYNVGDTVRIKQSRQVFKKGYLPSWAEEIFTIAGCHQTDPVTYSLKDYEGEVISRRFYTEELQKIEHKADRTFKIEQVIKTRKHNNKTEYL